MKNKPEYYGTLKENIGKSLEGEETLESKGSVFNDNLPLAELTPEDVTKVNGYVTTFTAAGLDAVSEKALATMKKSPEIVKVTATISAGDFGNISYDVSGAKKTTIPPAEKGGEATTGMSYGSTRIGLEFKAGESSGLLGQVRKSVKEAAKASLAK